MGLGRFDAWNTWFKRGELFWYSVLLAGLGMAWWACRPHTQDTVRQLGLFYELIGILAVIFEIAKLTKKHHDYPLHIGIAIRFAKYWRDIPLFTRKRNAVVGVAATSSGSGSVRARGNVGSLPNATLEERVVLVERQVQSLDDRLETVDARIEAEEKARAAAISAEAAHRERRDTELRGEIKEVETGGLDWSLVGIWWILVGTVLSTGTAELCCWVLQCV